MIRSVTRDDAEAICRIYNHYILNTPITFEEEALTVSEMAARIDEYTREYPWVVYEDEGGIRGYAYAGKWKGRSAYRFTVESSIYLDASATGRGLGSLLYGELLAQLKSSPVHAVIAGITVPNQASVALHEKVGFKKIGEFREVGWKFGRWLDVGYWQLLLPR
ncbi:N-acetyltransferase [Geomonas sp. Red276]